MSGFMYLIGLTILGNFLQLLSGLWSGCETWVVTMRVSRFDRVGTELALYKGNNGNHRPNNR